MILEIYKNNPENIKLLVKFIASMGNSSDSFRYYKSRSISVIKDHVCTVVLLYNSEPIGYGHLDKEEDNVWLGISISQEFRGKGKGNIIIQYLIDRADKLKIGEIKLSVDRNNVQAIKLYVKYGFELFYEENEVLFFSRKLAL